MPVAACTDAARWKERWRFIEVEDATGVQHPDASWAEVLGGLTPLGGPGPLGADGEPIPAPPGLGLPEPAMPCFAPAHVRPGQPAGVGRHTAYGKFLDPKPPRSASSRKGFIYRRQKAGNLIETAIGIPPLAPMWEERPRWRTAFEGRWQFPQEHFHVKEMSICGTAMRRAARSGGVIGTRMLFPTGNLTAACSLEKVRARSWALNGICRRVAAYTLGCSIRAHWRSIVSERNVADEGSRRPLVSRPRIDQTTGHHAIRSSTYTRCFYAFDILIFATASPTAAKAAHTTRARIGRRRACSGGPGAATRARPSRTQRVGAFLRHRTTDIGILPCQTSGWFPLRREARPRVRPTVHPASTLRNCICRVSPPISFLDGQA